MIRSPATPGRTGPPWCRRRALVTCARPRIKVTTAEAVARAGIKMSKKFNTESTSHGGLRIRPKIIDRIHNQWCRDNGYPVRKPTSPQAQRRKTSSHKLRAQAGVQSQRAPEPGNRNKDERAQAPGYKLPG